MNLQITLIILGIIIIAAIYFYSRWQEKRQKNQRNQISASRNKEPLFGAPAFDTVTLADDDIQEQGDSDMPAARHSTDYDADQSYADRSYVEYADAYRFSSKDESDNKVDHVGPCSQIEESEDGDDIPILENIVDGAVGQVSNISGKIGRPEIDQVSNPVQEMAEEIETIKEKIETVVGESAIEKGVEEIVLAQVESATDQPDYESTDSGLDSETTPFSEPPVEPVKAETSRTQPEPSSVVGQLANTPVSLATEPQTDEVLPGRKPDGISAQADDVDHAIYVDKEPGQEQNHDESEARPSLKDFLGSIGPISRIRENINRKLENVRAEREGRSVKVEPENNDEAVRIDITTNRQQDIFTATDGLEDMDATSATMLESPLESPIRAEQVQPIEPTLAIDSASQPFQPAEGFEKLSQIDYYVKLNGERDVSRESVLAVYREGAIGLSKKHNIFGLRLPDKVWRDLENEPEESRFGDLVVTMQLADQRGPVSERDLTRFSNVIMKLSETTGRGFSFMAPIESAREQSLAIDRFRKRYESIFVLNIKPEKEEFFEGPTIDRCATQIGLTIDQNCFYARYKPVGKTRVCLYSLANMSDTGEFDIENMRAVRTRGVTFFTRPAINRTPGAVFAEMFDAAKAFASRIKGEVIAPGFDELSSDDVEAIRRSIEKVAQQMDRHGISPGSDEATKLFLD